MPEYKTAVKGIKVDITKYMSANAEKPALGNMSVNARGDLIQRGKVVKTAEQLAYEYNTTNLSAVKKADISVDERGFIIPNTEFVDPVTAIKQLEDNLIKSKRNKRLPKE